MKIRVFNYLLVIVLLCLELPQAFGQLRINSPYSRYGIGELYSNESGFSRLRGGIAYGVPSETFVNSKNPASYAAVDSSSFVLDVGYAGFFLQSESSVAKSNYNYFNLDYLKAAFPITSWWRTSIGLSPYAYVGYNVLTNQSVDSVGDVDLSYKSDGGINRLNFGNAFIIGKHLRLGINASWMFGTANYQQITEIPDNEYAYAFRLTNAVKVKSPYFDIGAQYNTHFGKEKAYNLTIGAVFSYQQALKASSNRLGETYELTTSGYEYIKDTVLNQSGGSGSIDIPMYYGGGFYLQKEDKWSLGMDFTMQQWENYSYFGQIDSLKNSMSINFGASYRLGRVVLSAGARYNESYLKLNGNNINELGMTFGLSLPLFIDQQNKTFPYLDFGTEICRRGIKTDGLIQESYLKFFVGLSIKSNWFRRPKYY